jgi:Peptidase family S41
MNQLRKLSFLPGFALLLLPAIHVRADVTNAAPDFHEVYDLIRTHLAGQTDDELNQAAVRGLLEQLHARVSLVDSPAAAPASPEDTALVQSTIFDGPIARLRIARVTDGLSDKLSAACKSLLASNQLKGIVLDLRFARGHDYAAAVAAANLFISKEQPLLDWGNGFVNSKANADALTVPLIVLVNHQTADASEAFAAILREAAHAVILGSPTAGEATIGHDFPLKNGQFLRIATANIKLDNNESLSAAGVKPDIQIAVGPDDEKLYFADPYKNLTAATAPTAGSGPSDVLAGLQTNRIMRTHLTEADLIRERQQRPGMELEYEPGTEDTEAEMPRVHDPVLARALDLVKGISVMDQPRSP